MSIVSNLFTHGYDGGIRGFFVVFFFLVFLNKNILLAFFVCV